MNSTRVKTDLVKIYPKWYKASASPEVIHFDKANYLSIEGKGDPSEEEYAHTLSALFAVAYTVKFHYKAQGLDFTVAKLEGQWWFDAEKFGEQTIDTAPKEIPRSEWNYRSLIRLPEFVDKDLIPEMVEKVRAKKNLPNLNRVFFYEMPESYFVQILHVGPFEDEPKSLTKLKDLIDSKGFKKNGEHHEIYLSDFRKTKPEKFRTILREPVI